MHPIFYLSTPLIAGAVGWLAAPDSSPRDTQAVSPEVSRLPVSGTTLSNSFRQEASLGELGNFGILSDGRRVFTGPRDVTLLEKTARVAPQDFSALSEMMSQLSQMNDAELADAWAEMSRQAPREGVGSVLVATYALTRLEAAGIEIELPFAWANAVQELTPAIDADEVRRNPEVFREKLVAGDTLTTGQREALLRQLAVENPAETARLWLEHSTPEQLGQEAHSLALLMSDEQARTDILKSLQTKVTSEVERDAVYSTLLGEWAIENRGEVADFIAKTSDPLLRDTAKLSLLNAHFEHGPQEAVAYAATFEGPMREYALTQSMAVLGQQDAAAASELFSEMSDPTDRLAATRGLSYPLASENYEDFLAWREQLSAAEREIAHQETFPIFARNEVESAVAWLNDHPEGPVKENLKADLMRVYAKDHPETSMNLLASFYDPQAKRKAAAIVLAVTDPANLDRVQEVLTVANDPNSGVDLTLEDGAALAPLSPSREAPCRECGGHH